MKDSIWPAWALALILVLVAAVGPWHVGGDNAPAVRRVPALASDSPEATFTQEARFGALRPAE